MFGLTQSPATATGIQKLTDFDGVNGRNPSAALTLGTDGLLYGTTYFGGDFGRGTIFSFDPISNALTSLYSSHK